MPSTVRALSCCFLASAVVLGGCTSAYRVPGAAANFARMGIEQTEPSVDDVTDPGVLEVLRKEPVATFPARIAVVRVQERGYRSYTTKGWGTGDFSIVTTRDVEEREDFARLDDLPMIDDATRLNRLVLPEGTRSEEDLRQAAASVQANMLLLYTFDTHFDVDSAIPPLGLLTLGLFPERVAKVDTTASAVLLDVRTGYVYALAEASDDTEQIANTWTDEDAVDQSRRRVERRAFEAMLEDFEDAWGEVVREHASSTRSASLR